MQVSCASAWYVRVATNSFSLKHLLNQAALFTPYFNHTRLGQQAPDSGVIFAIKHSKLHFLAGFPNDFVWVVGCTIAQYPMRVNHWLFVIVPLAQWSALAWYFTLARAHSSLYSGPPLTKEEVHKKYLAAPSKLPSTALCLRAKIEQLCLMVQPYFLHNWWHAVVQ